MEKPLLVTAAIIIKDNKILLIKRAREPFKGHWSFVSGCGAFDRTCDPFKAVQLEVKCDLNCEFKPIFLPITLKNFEEIEMPSITFFFCGTINGKLKISSKYVSEIKWFTLQEASKLKLGFEHNKIINVLLKNSLPKQ